MAYSYNRDRDEFIVRMTREGMTLENIRALLRLATTIQRLAVAQCNGDYPADGGSGRWDTTECPTCERLWAVESLHPHRELGPGRHCEDCRADIRVGHALKDSGWIAKTGGDPRGCTLKLYRKDSTPADRDSGRAEYVCVPARDR